MTVARKTWVPEYHIYKALCKPTGFTFLLAWFTLCRVFNQLMGHPKLCYVLVRNRDRTGTVSGTVPARNNVGPVRSRNIFCSGARTFSLFLVRPSRRSHLVHPLPSRTYDAEQSTRCPPLYKQCSSAIVISTTVICRLKYPNRRPRQL